MRHRFVGSFVLECELEVRKFELLLGPTSSATEQEKGMARTLLLSSLQNSAKPPYVDAEDNGTASASPAALDARYSRSRTSVPISDNPDAEAVATRDVDEAQQTESPARSVSTESQ
jgi:cytoskeletal protein RodZ